MGRFLFAMLIPSKHCQVVLDLEEDLFIPLLLIPFLAFFILLFTKNLEAGFFFFSLSYIPLDSFSTTYSSSYPLFLIDSWHQSLPTYLSSLRLLYVCFLFSVFFFFCGSRRLPSLSLLLTLLTYTLLLRFINKQKKKLAREGGGPEGRGVGREEEARIGGTFFFFF
ncbi:hypothetical protein HOY82DRAFT_61257 [Tuber indicum]|nr:hypothetical protein HOY82DRAFT_61257 [Tuber indicum]